MEDWKSMLKFSWRLFATREWCIGLSVNSFRISYPYEFRPKINMGCASYPPCFGPGWWGRKRYMEAKPKFLSCQNLALPKSKATWISLAKKRTREHCEWNLLKKWYKTKRSTNLINVAKFWLVNVANKLWLQWTPNQTCLLLMLLLCTMPALFLFSSIGWILGGYICMLFPISMRLVFVYEIQAINKVYFLQK